MKNLKALGAIVLAGASLALTGCSQLEELANEVVTLETPVATESNLTAEDYRRDYFGDGWLDLDGDGCNTRQEILQRDLEQVVLASNGCTVLSGVLNDPYQGDVIQFTHGQETSQEVPIDHLVPLAYAWYTGADQWTAEKREQFANDPANLVATGRSANSSKSDSGPSEWLPGQMDKCEYVTRFSDLATSYGLILTPEDQALVAQCS